MWTYFYKVEFGHKGGAIMVDVLVTLQVAIRNIWCRVDTHDPLVSLTFWAHFSKTLFYNDNSSTLLFLVHLTSWSPRIWNQAKTKHCYWHNVNSIPHPLLLPMPDSGNPRAQCVQCPSVATHPQWILWTTTKRILSATQLQKLGGIIKGGWSRRAHFISKRGRKHTSFQMVVISCGVAKMTVSIFMICSKVLGVRAEYPLANFDLGKLARLHKRIIVGSRGTDAVHMWRWEGTSPRATTSTFAGWILPSARRCAHDNSVLRDRSSLLLIGKCLKFDQAHSISAEIGDEISIKQNGRRARKGRRIFTLAHIDPCRKLSLTLWASPT